MRSTASRPPAPASGGVSHSPRSSVCGARISAGSRRPSRAGSSATGSAAVSNRPVETSTQAAPTPSLFQAIAISRFGRPASSRVSSVIVPGVMTRTTSRLIGSFPGAGLGVFHLLDDGDAKAPPDQPGEIGLGCVVRNATHRYWRPVMLAAMAQRDVERGRSRFRVGEEQFVEIAHAEKQQRIGMVGLCREPLRHGRRRAGRRQNFRGAVGSGVHTVCQASATAGRAASRFRTKAAIEASAAGVIP